MKFRSNNWERRISFFKRLVRLIVHLKMNKRCFLQEEKNDVHEKEYRDKENTTTHEKGEE